MADKPKRLNTKAPGAGQPDAAGESDAKSNLGAKLVIVVFFLMAFGLGALATTIQLQNRTAQERIVSSAWPLNSTEALAIEDAWMDQEQNFALTDWERVQIAESMKDHLNEYIRIKYTTGIENWDDQKATPATIVDRVARELKIPVEGNVKFDQVRTRAWNAWDPKRVRDFQKKFNETTFSFTFEKLTRRQVLEFVLRIEDQYSFLRIRDMDMQRKDDSATGDAWKVRLTAVWYDRVARSSSSS